MATYYWVGGSGTWNNASNTNWALSTGGAGGAGIPTSADNVIFDANSGTAATVTVAATATALAGIAGAFGILWGLAKAAAKGWF